MVEYERKKLLDKIEYQKLMSELIIISEYEEILQVNYYYDDNCYSLYANNETLRIRQIDGNLKCEYKFNKRLSGGVRISDEISKSLNYLPRKICIGERAYSPIGALTTLRKLFVVECQRVFLDCSYYAGMVDYEIEIESDHGEVIPSVIEEICTFKSLPPNKYGRFVNATRRAKENFSI